MVTDTGNGLRLHLGLDNSELYHGCQIESVGGRANLTTPVSEAVNLVGTNINKWAAELPSESRGTIILTGPMAVWAYLVVFHAVVHRFTKVYYDDGRNPVVLIAAHG